MAWQKSKVSTVYLGIRLCDVRAARAVRRAGSSQRWASDVEHLPRRAEVSFSLAPHVQVGWEGFYSRDSGRGRWKAGDVYWAADRSDKTVSLKKKSHKSVTRKFWVSSSKSASCCFIEGFWFWACGVCCFHSMHRLGLVMQSLHNDARGH